MCSEREHEERRRHGSCAVVQQLVGGAVRLDEVGQRDQAEPADAGKLRADDMSQPSTGVMKSSAYSRKCETCAAIAAASAACRPARAESGLNSRQISRSSASARIVMPTDLCVASDADLGDAERQIVGPLARARTA